MGGAKTLVQVIAIAIAEDMNPKIVQAQRISRSQMLLVGIAYSGSMIVTVPLPKTCNMPSPSTKAQVSSSIPIPSRSG